MRIPTIVGAAVCLFLPGAVGAQDYPNRAVRIVIPFVAGGQFDIIGRPIADYLTRALGQSFLIESRPGAGGSTGATFVAQAKPDGYTLLMASTSTLAVNPAVYKKLAYDPVKSFVPIITVTEAPLVMLTGPSTGFKSAGELIKAISASPMKYSFASPGLGTPPHLFGELLSIETKSKLLHVPYSGGAAAVNDLVAGHVSIFFDSLASGVAQAQGGKVVPLLIAGPRRVEALPDVPTSLELGLTRLNTLTWNAFAAPAGTPKEITRLLYRHIAASLKSPDVRNAIQRVSMTPVEGGENELAERISRDLPIWREIAVAAGAVQE